MVPAGLLRTLWGVQWAYYCRLRVIAVQFPPGSLGLCGNVREYTHARILYVGMYLRVILYAHIYTRTTPKTRHRSQFFMLVALTKERADSRGVDFPSAPLLAPSWLGS